MRLELEIDDAQVSTLFESIMFTVTALIVIPVAACYLYGKMFDRKKIQEETVDFMLTQLRENKGILEIVELAALTTYLKLCNDFLGRLAN